MWPLSPFCEIPLVMVSFIFSISFWLIVLSPHLSCHFLLPKLLTIKNYKNSSRRVVYLFRKVWVCIWYMDRGVNSTESPKNQFQRLRILRLGLRDFLFIPIDEASFSEVSTQGCCLNSRFFLYILWNFSNGLNFSVSQISFRISEYAKWKWDPKMFLSSPLVSGFTKDFVSALSGSPTHLNRYLIAAVLFIFPSGLSGRAGPNDQASNY